MNRNRLNFLVYRIMTAIRDACPDAVVTSSYNTFEDVDAIVDAYVPEAHVERLRDLAVEMSDDILVNEGYNIVVWVNELAEYTPRQSVALTMAPAPA